VTPPRVSVAMPVRDAMPYLADSLRSVLDQTLEDFEFVILDDGSTDGSTELLRETARSDSRIRLFERRESCGLTEAFNYVVTRCVAPLVARMDADDVSRPERLQRQLEAMQGESHVVLVGALADGIDSEGRRVRPRDRWRLIRCTEIPFTHGSAMFRRRAFDEAGGYRPAAGPWADVDLLLRLGDRGRVVVLPEALYSYRYHLDCSTLEQPLEEAARSTDSLRRFLAVRRAGRAEDRILEGEGEDSVDPDAVAATAYTRGAMRLWAGALPVVDGLTPRGGSFRFSRTWLRTLLWTAWARVSPATLRLFLRGLIRARDLVAGARLRDGRPHEWRFR
jgi:glycosyltransferase involved in cell wall biosynthesis